MSVALTGALALLSRLAFMSRPLSRSANIGDRNNLATQDAAH